MPVCITGMHRSGASIVARLMNMAGLELGREQNLLPANLSNPEGHWEHERIVEINDDILSEFGGGWDNPPDLSGLSDRARIDRIEKKARGVLQEFDQCDFWGWKDPRNCLTLPFWQALISNLKVVVCLRNPLEVALSLRRRGASSYALGLSLWTTYNERVLQVTSSEGRIVTHYANYFDDPVGELRRISDRLAFPVSNGQVNAVQGVTKRELRHSRFTVADLIAAGVSTHVVDLYEQLCGEAGLVEGEPRFLRKRGSKPMVKVGAGAGRPDERPSGPFNGAVIESDVLRGELRSRDHSLREVQTHLHAEKERVRDANARVTALEARARASEEVRAQLEMRADKLSIACAEAMARVTQLEAEVAKRGLVVAALEKAVIDKDAAAAQLREELAARDRMLVELRRAGDQQAADIQRQEIDLAGRNATIRSLEQQLERSMEEARRRETAAHDLQLQLTERSSWAFHMVERLTQHHSSEGVAAPGPAAPAASQAAGNGASVPDPELPHGVSQQSDPVTSRQEPAAAFESEAQRARQTNYAQLVRRATTLVKESVPANATVVVVSRGDENLLDLGGRRGWHFPQTASAVYAGHYPADSAAAISHLERLRSNGAQFLLFPLTSLWWLNHYSAFADHLNTRYRRIVARDDVGVLFDVRDVDPAVPLWKGDLASAIEELEGRLGRSPAILDCDSGLDLGTTFPRHTVFAAPSEAVLPYLDSTIEMVVTSASCPRAREARRVAKTILVTAPSESGSTPGGARLRVQWLEARPDAMPSVSIIIPCHNGAELTDACLAALALTLPRNFRGEAIVVDDASNDGTRAMLGRRTKQDKRIKVLRNPKNLGFLRSCNRAAKAARGDILVFLNNDTVPTRGWLTALLSTFHTHPDAGAVGGKLVLPDGTLQEAGSLVFRDGSAMNFGRGDRDTERPLFNYVREVDYCSGALLATPRRLFNKLGGFDGRYVPAYYEDTDYCFKVREKGRRVYYQPAARVTHHEGASCGTDLTSGVKRYQVLNRDKFVDRWKTELERQPERPGDETLETWQRLAVRSA
jgi:GT2 family glycosyltransferase